MKYSLLSLLLLVVTSLHATHLSYTDGVVDDGDFMINRVVKQGKDYIEVSYQLGGVSIEKTTVNEQDLHWIRMSDAAVLEEKGNPELPVLNDKVSVASINVKVEVVNASYKEYKEFLVYPSRGPIVQSQVDSIGDLYFSDVYEKNALFPVNNVEVVTVQSYRSYPFATVRFCPVQYNPVTKTIKCCTNITYRISWKNRDFSSASELPGDDDLPLNYAKMPSMLRGIVADYVPTSDSSKASLRSSSFSKNNADYLIVTTAEYLPAVEKLKQWKSMLGYKCKLLVSDWVLANDVKKAIQTQYMSNEKPEYLLIVGGLGDVPAYLTDYPDDDDQLKYGSWASDLMYVCMDGSYDYTADMAKGRIPVRSLDEAMTVVDKIIKYEKDPILDEDFYNTALHCAYFQDDEKVNGVINDGVEDRRFVLTSEEIRNYMMGWGKNVTRVYTAKNLSVAPQYYSKSYSNGAMLPSELYGYGSMWKGSGLDIINNINKGAFYVLHRDHGNLDGWGDPSFKLSEIEKLKNGEKTPVVFSINCLTGGFQKPICFSTNFLRKENGGAVGVFGASAISYSGYNDALVIGMFDAMYPLPGVDMTWGSSGKNYKFEYLQPTFHMGHVLNQGLLLMGDIKCTDSYTNKIFHYFGDPSMELRTETPVCLDATVEKNGAVVTVKTDVPGCRISLCSADDGGDSYVQSYDDVSEATFYDVDFNYAVTVYKHNYVPFVYNGDTYIQNQVFSADENVLASSIWAGNHVTESEKKGDVVVSEGNVKFYASQTINLASGFSVGLTDDNSSFLAQVDNVSCQSTADQPEGVYSAIPSEPQQFAPSDGSENVIIQEVESSSLTQEEDLLAIGVKCYVQDDAIVVELGDWNAQVIVSDAAGKQVAKQEGSGTIRLNVDKGVYVVTLLSSDSLRSSKVINE